MSNTIHVPVTEIQRFHELSARGNRSLALLVRMTPRAVDQWEKGVKPNYTHFTTKGPNYHLFSRIMEVFTNGRKPETRASRRELAVKVIKENYDTYFERDAAIRAWEAGEEDLKTRDRWLAEFAVRCRGEGKKRPPPVFPGDPDAALKFQLWANFEVSGDETTTRRLWKKVVRERKEATRIVRSRGAAAPDLHPNVNIVGPVEDIQKALQHSQQPPAHPPAPPLPPVTREPKKGKTAKEGNGASRPAETPRPNGGSVTGDDLEDMVELVKDLHRYGERFPGIKKVAVEFQKEVGDILKQFPL